MPTRKNEDVTTISNRGQTVIPAHIRKRLGLREGSKLRWVIANDSIVVVPESDDPIDKLAGMFRGEGMLKRLLEARRRDRDREAR